MHGSLHPQIELFYCLEKFSLVIFITFYAKEKNLPATFESKKNSIKIARLGCYGKHVRILRNFFFLVRIINRLAGLNRESKQLEKLQNTYLSEYIYLYFFTF